METIKTKLTKENLFYVTLSISSGLVFSLIFKKLENGKKSSSLSLETSGIHKAKNPRIEELSKKEEVESPGLT